MVWRLGVKLPKPIYKKFSCFKNESFVWCIFLNLAAHAVPLFISSKILPLQMLYAEKVSSIIFDVSCMNAPSNICDLFTKANSKHKHARDQDFFVWKLLCPNFRQNLNQDSFSRSFKKSFHDFLLSIMEAEDDYVEVPILLQKITNSAALTKCSNNW